MPDENSVNSEVSPTPALEVDASWQKRVKRVMPYAAGALAFIVGLIFLAPLESYAYLMLRQLSASGISVEVGELSLSALGRFKAESLRVPFGPTGSAEAQMGTIKIAEAKGRVDLLDLLNDKFDFNLEALIIAIRKGDIAVRIDTLELASQLEQNRAQASAKSISGTITLTASSAQVSYKETKYLKEEITIPFAQITLKVKAQQNNFTIETGEALGRMVNAQIKGTINLTAQQQDLNLNVILKLTNEFFEKYQDKDPRTLLKFAGILQDDGRIEFNVRGSMSQPIIEPVKATGQPGMPGVSP